MRKTSEPLFVYLSTGKNGTGMRRDAMRLFTSHATGYGNVYAVDVPD